MKTCRTCEEKLPAYLEGHLPAAEIQDLERHLADCPDCRSALEDFRKTGNLLAGLEEREPPPWFTQKVMGRIREEAGEKKGLIRLLFIRYD